MSPTQLIDIEKYPIDDLTSENGKRLVVLLSYHPAPGQTFSPDYVASLKQRPRIGEIGA